MLDVSALGSCGSRADPRLLERATCLCATADTVKLEVRWLSAPLPHRRVGALVTSLSLVGELWRVVSSDAVVDDNGD